MYYVENKTFELVTTEKLSATATIGLTFLDSSGSPNGWIMLTGTTVRYSCTNQSIGYTSDNSNVGGIFEIFKTPERIEVQFQKVLFLNYTYKAGCNLEEQAYGFTFLSDAYPKHTATTTKFKVPSECIRLCWFYYLYISIYNYVYKEVA